MLYQPAKQIQLVMGEAALHTRFGTTETLMGQLARLVAVAGLAGIEIGVVPFTTRMPVYPLTGFELRDDAVMIESITAQQRLDAPDEVALYERFFEQLREAALTGADAVALIHQVMAGLRG